MVHGGVGNVGNYGLIVQVLTRSLVKNKLIDNYDFVRQSDTSYEWDDVYKRLLYRPKMRKDFYGTSFERTNNITLEHATPRQGM